METGLEKLGNSLTGGEEYSLFTLPTPTYTASILQGVAEQPNKKENED